MRLKIWGMAAAMAMASAGRVVAEPEQANQDMLLREIRELRQQVQAQQAQIDELLAASQPATAPCGASGGAREEEVRQIVSAMLADADARRDWSGGGPGKPVAGYNRGFYIGTDDGNNLLRFNLTSQTRYMYTHREAAPATGDRDLDESGFQQRLTWLNFQGNVFDPKWTYRVRLAADAEGGSLKPDWAWVGYQISDDFNLQVGQLKPPFLREELIAADRQLAAERSYTNDYFTADFSQGVQLTYWKDRLQVLGMIHDGSYAWRTDFANDRTTVAGAARVEYLVLGEASLYRQRGWRPLGEFTSWSDERPAVLLGAALDAELGEQGQGTHGPDVLKWTTDVSGKFGGWNAFAALMGQTFNANGSGGQGGIPADLDNTSQLGVVTQAGLFVVPDKVELFSRYEWLFFDDVYYRNDGGNVQSGSGSVAEDDLSIVTLGVNYYLLKQNAKVTFDVQYALDPIPVTSNAQGLLATPDSGEVIVRGQFTLSF